MKTISVNELKQRLDEQAVVLVDVREPAEHRSERIEGAHSIPLSECCLKKIPSTAQPIVIHCRSGKRSLEACRRLRQENPQIDVCSLEGGISAWEQAGFPVERAKKFGASARSTNTASGRISGFQWSDVELFI